MARGKVLIVEDEAMIQILLEDLCEASDCDVVGVVDNVPDALTAVQTLDFNVAILDVHLAHGHSEPVAEALRELGKPVLVATGSSEGQLPSAYDGFTVLQKPFHFREVALLLKQTAF